MQWIFKLILPFGITTYALLVTSLIMGMAKAPLKLHKVIAVITLIFATLHAGIIIYAKLSRGS